MKRKPTNPMKITTHQSHVLVKLGFSEQEAKVYYMLVEKGALTVNEIAKTIQALPQAIYRTTQSLEEKGMIGLLGNSPRTYQAIPPALALPRWSKRKQSELDQNILQVMQSLTNKINSSNQTQIKLTFNRSQAYKRAIELMGQCTKEILLISEGNPNAPQDLLLATKRAIDRGVKIKFIVHRFDESNKNTLENFKRNGYEIRHIADWGFHLYIFDDAVAMLGANNPENVEQRVTIEFQNKGLVKAMRDYFNHTWEKSIEV